MMQFSWPDIRRLGLVVRRVINTPEAFALLDAAFPAATTLTWTSGGCWLLAAALKDAVAGSQIMVVATSETQCDHVVVVIGDWLMDGDGAFSWRNFPARWATREGRSSPTLQSFDRTQALQSGLTEPPAPAVSKLSDMLRCAIDG